MEFKLNGQKVEPRRAFNKDIVQKYLDSLPDGELMDTSMIQEKLRYSLPDHIRDRIRRELPDYSVQGEKKKCYFGNKKTIKEYKKQVMI